MVDVLDDLFGHPVTSGAVGVLEGRQCAPCDALGRPHHPLESAAVAGSAVAVPGGDKAQKDVLNGASVKVCEDFRCQAKLLQPPEVEEALLHLLHHTVWVVHFRLSVMCTPWILTISSFTSAFLSM